MIEAEPLDLLGPAHQRLVMHCLSEVTSDIPTRTVLERRLSKWLLFECKFRHTALLAREEEFPACALETALREGSEKVKVMILQSLTHLAIISGKIIKLIASWLDHQNLLLHGAVVEVLVGRSELPEEILHVVAERLGDEDVYVRRSAVKVLRGGWDLPEEILQAVAERLGDEDAYVHRSAVEVLGGRLDLPEEILQAVAGRLGNENEDIGMGVEALLRKEEKLYGTVLNGPYASALCKVVLRQSFDKQLAWFIDKDGCFCFNSPEQMMVFSANNHVNDVIANINKIQPTDFPYIGLDM